MSRIRTWASWIRSTFASSGAARAQTRVAGSFDAFISYRHVAHDRRWALWLHSSLEGYRTPKKLRAERPEVKPRLERVFRDEDELAASTDLGDRIDDALRASRYLLVVCSRATPGSRWVNEEIARFRRLGGGDRILALLTDGEPAQAFPPALLELRPERAAEPLAADVRPREGDSARQRKRMALLRILAPILGCRFDDIRQREMERVQARRRRLATAAVLAASLTAAAVGRIAYLSKSNAERQRAVVAGGLLSKARLEMEQDPASLPHAMLLALEADRIASGVGSRMALLAGLELLPLPGAARTSNDAPSLAALAVVDAEAFLLRASGRLEQVSLAGAAGIRTLWMEEGAPAAADGSETRAVMSGDGQRVVRFDGGGRAIVAETATGRIVRGFPIGAARPVAAALSFDGAWLVTVDRQRHARRWTVPAGRTGAALDLPRLTHASVTIGGLAIDGQGSRLALYSDFTDGSGFAVWILEGGGRGVRVRRLPADDFPQGIGFTPDDRLVTASGGVVQVRDLDGDRAPLRFRAGRTAATLRFAFSRDGRLLATSSLPPPVQVWDLVSGSELARMAPEGLVRGVGFAPSGRTLVTGIEGALSNGLELRAWNLGSTLAFRRASTRQARGTETLALAPDGRHVAVADARARRVRVLEVDTSATVASVEGEDVSELSIAGSPPMLVGRAQDAVKRWSFPALRAESPWRTTGQPEAISPDGRLCAWRHVHERRSEIVVQRTIDAAPAGEWTGPGIANRLQFSPRGRWLVAAVLPEPAAEGDADVLAMDLASRRADRTVYGRNPARFAFDAGETVLAAAGDGPLRVYRLPGLARALDLPQDSRVDGVALSTDGSLLASASTDGYVRIHSARNGAELYRYPVTLNASGDARLAFDRSHRWLVGGFLSSDMVWMWPIDQASIRRDVCARLLTSLAEQEWTPLAPGEPYQPSCGTDRERASPAAPRPGAAAARPATRAP